MLFTATRFSMLFAALLPLSALGCGGGDSAASEPVASTALTGVIDGKPFTAKFAVGITFPDSTELHVQIAETEITCSNSALPDRVVLTSVEWKEGTALPFGSKTNATLAFDSGGTPQNKVSFDGRIEVIKAPAPPKSGDPAPTGTIRLRANVDDNNHVEGQVDVAVCAPF